MALGDPVTGAELGPEFDIGNIAANTVRLKLGAGLAIAPDGTISATGAGRQKFGVSGGGVINNGGTVLDAHPTSLTFTPGTAGLSWQVTAHATVSNDSTGNDFVGALRFDGVAARSCRIEPQDSAGAGPTLPTVDGGTDNSGTNQRIPIAMSVIVNNVAAVAHTVDFAFASSGATGTEATVYDLTLTAEQLS